MSEDWLDALRGREVLGLDVSSDVEDGRTRQEEDTVYGVRIQTERGTVTLAFRNSSNGYYGGWAGLSSEHGGTDWREITGNEWSA